LRRGNSNGVTYHLDHRLPIWTIGYERASSDALQSALKAAGVQVLMDVRDLPLSRRAGFSKSTLRASLEAAGIEYVHLRRASARQRKAAWPPVAATCPCSGASWKSA
jgi:hypothetical protein